MMMETGHPMLLRCPASWQGIFRESSGRRRFSPHGAGMRRLVLKAILNLGRYAVLPVVALAGALLLVWLMALDHYTIAALATAPVVFCVATAALALALGILLLPSRRDRDFRADEAAAPGVWAIWQELDRTFVRSERTLTIDDNFNASIMEEARYAGLFRQRVTMRIGLPLLIFMDKRAIRAVIAHEIAHTRLRYFRRHQPLRLPRGFGEHALLRRPGPHHHRTRSSCAPRFDAGMARGRIPRVVA
jgi:hypothetical protein